MVLLQEYAHRSLHKKKMLEDMTAVPGQALKSPAQQGHSAWMGDEGPARQKGLTEMMHLLPTGTITAILIWCKVLNPKD